MGFLEELVAVVRARRDFLWGEILGEYGSSPLEKEDVYIVILIDSSWRRIAHLFTGDVEGFLENFGLKVSKETKHAVVVNLAILFEVLPSRLEGFNAEEIYNKLVKLMDRFLTEELYHLWEWSRGELTDTAPSDFEKGTLTYSLEEAVKHYSYGAEHRALKAVVKITGQEAVLLEKVEEALETEEKTERDS